MLNQQFIKHIIASIRFLAEEFLELPVGLLSRLVQGENAFVQHLIDFGGLEAKTINGLLNESNPTGIATSDVSNSLTSLGVVVDTILMISQLARISEDYYKPIHDANMYAAWGRLFTHHDPNVRAKMCNLIGNLCKHSNFFYTELERFTSNSILW